MNDQISCKLRYKHFEKDTGMEDRIGVRMEVKMEVRVANC